ncbi:amidase [Bradyrhizobium betae]|uniref:Amidase n=1 Tax=Bradyrhizobium betae TaxID=244734 RepID=A0A4Q1VND8_9BRAD|nr:amidase [Bradyrhizobium betae]RXT54205.1 amidase [Bradyrhizobium betae]
MSFKIPSIEQIRKLGDGMGMDITNSYAEAFINYIAPFADGYRQIAALPDDVPPIKYPRGHYYRPEGDENKHGAWIAKVNIKGATSGPLAGKKVAIKDTYSLAGVPLTNGASVLEGYVPEFDAPVITRLLDAGAEVIGKSTCEYFSFSGGAATSTSGPVHNPRAWGHTAGGSSTGSGALVALGEVDMAMGGDQAGSIRIPASLSGVVGIKPTWGLVPYTGIMGMDPTIDHAGPLTATVAENALFLEVLAGKDGYDSRQSDLEMESYTKAIGQGIAGMKIGVVKEGFGQYDSHPDVDAGVQAAAKKLESLGARVDEISIPWHLTGVPIWAAIALEGTYHGMITSPLPRHTEGVYPISLAGRLGSLRDRANELPDTVKVGMLLGAYTDKYYQGYFYYKAQNLRRRLRAAYDKALGSYDLLLMPTTRMMASKIPPPDAPLEQMMQHCWEQITNTSPFNVTHHPAISIPCGLGEGNRPIGLMLVGKHWRESTVYRAADAFERAGNWQSMGPSGKR